MFVVVSQTLFMQLRRVVGPFDTEEQADQWISWNWNEYETCSVLKIETPFEAPKPTSLCVAAEAISAAGSAEQKESAP